MRVALSLVALAGCAMYGPPEHLHKVEPRPVPPGSDVAAPLAYVDDCATDFHRDARVVRVLPRMAEALVQTGNASRDVAVKSTGSKQVELTVSSIHDYADALRADPYNASATLELAVAYDRVLRKGCALAMLRRLATLATNPKVAPDASDRVADVVDNPQWFRGYRKDALAAVDH